MYNFLTGPMAWISFSIFFIGIFIRSIAYIKGLDTNLDRVTYKVNTASGILEAIRSVAFWLVPFAARGWRTQPLMTVLFYVFHVGIVVSTLFLIAHNMLLEESWGIRFFTIPDQVSDIYVGCIYDFGILCGYGLFPGRYA